MACGWATTPRITGPSGATVDDTITPPVRLKAETLSEKYNELRIDAGRLRGHLPRLRRRRCLSLRNCASHGPGEGLRRGGALPFRRRSPVFFPEEESFFSHNERSTNRASARSAGDRATLPAVVATAAGPKVAIAESDLEDYPGLWLRGDRRQRADRRVPAVSAGGKATRDRDFKVTHAADYIAVTTRHTHVSVARHGHRRTTATWSPPARLAAAAPSQIADTSWIKPGKVAWDWWNDSNLSGVDFKPGVNTQTYKYFIDFAAKYGLEYIILDEGWYKLGNLLQVGARNSTCRS